MKYVKGVKSTRWTGNVERMRQKRDVYKWCCEALKGRN
jgi:hypothetical protein